METTKSTDLLIGFLTDGLTEPQQAELQAWLDASLENKALVDELKTEDCSQSFLDYMRIDTVRGWRKVQKYLDRKKRIKRSVISAAAVMLLLAVISWLSYQKNTLVTNSLIAPINIDTLANTFRYPTVTTSDRNIHRLDEGWPPHTAIVEQDNIELTMAGDHHLRYQYADGVVRSTTLSLYNIIDIPFGRPWLISLPDGSDIWLNAGSTMCFPIVNGTRDSQRIVSLSGQGLFNVKPLGDDGKKHFVVRSKGIEIDVTGTRFDVAGYRNDSLFQTTLLAGAVTVTSKNMEVKSLQPGEAAIVNSLVNSLKKMTVARVDTSHITSWTRGLLFFENAKLKEVLEKVKSAYDITVVVDNRIEKLEDRRIIGGIDVAMPLEEVARLLEKAFYVRAEVKNGQLKVGIKSTTK